MKYIYGPVQSRRLGNSLGLSLTPYKVCNLDCVYCQLGRTTYKTTERKEYIQADDIIEELKLWLANNVVQAKELSYITLAGSGEPTLNSRIADLIQGIKHISGIPIALITNAVLLSDPSVRKQILGADLIVPSLDAVTQTLFEKIGRPVEAAGIKIEDLVQGLIALRKEYKKIIWLEVMIVQGINDDMRHIHKLKDVIEQINPDKVQLNSPVRSTAQPNILPADKDTLEKIRGILGDKVQVI